MKQTAWPLRLVFLLVLTIPAAASIHAQTIISSPNVALHRPATASTVQTDKYTENAFDGNPNTRFSSLYSDSEWLSVDLGQVYLVSQVTLLWERAYGKDFDIQFSRDGSYADMLSFSIQVRNNVLGTDSIAGTNILAAKSNTLARYVRMQGIKRATVFGYSLYEFTIAGSISITNVVPVSISGLTASEQTGFTVLEWSTLSEYNNAGFSVEHSTDGSNFSAIGWVPSINAGTVPSHYSFTDRQASTGKNYYRLKVTDLTGKTGSTPAVAISTASTGTPLKAYPVPVKDHLLIEYRGNPGEAITIALFNCFGQPVYNSVVTVKGNPQTMSVDRKTNMLGGMYFLAVTSSTGKKYTAQVVLQ